MLKRKKILFIFLAILFLVCPLDRVFAINNYPRVANYFLNWSITSETQARDLARYDLLILDMEIQYNSLMYLKKIKQLNPDIILLVYISPHEIAVNANGSSSQARRELASGISEKWYLKNSQGVNLSWWPGNYILNITDQAPMINSKQADDYVVNFVVNKLLATGLWDGVFYDNAWDSITWFVGKDIDLNGDGQIDLNLDSQWRAGMKSIYNETRRLTGNKYYILGNGTTREYGNDLDGKMLENFVFSAWSPTMNTYALNNKTIRNGNGINIINANTKNTGLVSYKDMRFGMASALLENGYYSYDYGDQNHGQTWWYDEYDINLGEAISNSISKNNYTEYKPDVWQRDFANGIALVNSTGNKQIVSLGGEYEKIHGTQDKTTNDGSIVTETIIDGYDGLVLLKTFNSLNDVLFRNGDFVRFFSAGGERIRNGFFVFEEKYTGGDKIAHIDLDGDGERDLLVVEDNRIMAWRNDGQIFMKIYPYTANYHGELNVALGDLNYDGKKEIYVSAEPGYPYPIKIYTREGRRMMTDWYPYGEKYSGGYSIAVGHITGTKRNDLVVSKLSQEAVISIFDYNYNLAYQWLAFDKKIKIGVNVASGNIDGDDKDEIIVGAGKGYDPMIRVFDKEGKQVVNEFKAFTSFDKPGIEVLSADADFDGRADIIGMNSGF